MAVVFPRMSRRSIWTYLWNVLESVEECLIVVGLSLVFICLCALTLCLAIGP